MWPNPRIPFALSGSRPAPPPPNDKPLIVNLAMNIEYWPFDRPMPRGILPAPHGKSVQPPDIPNYAWVEYGLRAGLPRIMKMLGERGLRASALMNAQVIDVYPTLAEAILEAGWDFVGHGWYQQSLKDAEDEEAVIATSLERMRGFSGQEVRAWLGPGIGETPQTPDLLKKHGVDFLHDWTVDDLPCWMQTIHGPMLAMPYALDLNDVPIYAIQHSASDEILRRIEATLAVFEREAVIKPRVITIALHPHIVGVAHIAHHFERAIDLLLSREDVVFLTSSRIGEWFSESEIPAILSQQQPSDE